MKRDLADASATEALGDDLASAFSRAGQAGGVVYLQGDLGAGKTTLVRQMLRSLGVTGTIRSPTYTLMEPYGAGGRELLHMDLYRLSDPTELHNLGLVDYSPEQTLWLVEWPEKGGDFLPKADISVQLQVVGQARQVEIVGLSAAGRDIVSNLVK